MSRNPTSRNFTFVLNNYDDAQIEIIQRVANSSTIKYLIYGHEVGSSGTPHLQGYFDVAVSCRATGAKRLFGIRELHVEYKRESRPHAIKYCIKDCGDHYWESDPSLRGAGAGARSDLKSCCELIRTTKSMEGIITQYPASFVRFFRGFDRLLEHYTPAVSRESHQCILIIGPTGIGKSTVAARVFSDAYWWPKQATSPFAPHYNGEKTVILDDFYGWLPFDMMLRLIDKFPYQVNVMGRSVRYAAEMTIITTNEEVCTWYPNCQHRLPSLQRRIDTVYRVYSREDCDALYNTLSLSLL